MQQSGRLKMKHLRSFRLRSTSFFATSVEAHKPNVDRSVSRGIKHNDLSQIINLHKASVRSRGETRVPTSNSTQSLIDLRKKFDQFKNENDRLEGGIKRMKEQIALLKQQAEVLHQQDPLGKENQINAELDSVLDRLQFNTSSLLSYQHMQDRLKKDILSYSLKQNRLQKQLRILRLSKYQVEKQSVKFNQMTVQAQKFKHQLQDILYLKQADKHQQLIDIDRVLHQKQQDQAKTEQRQRQINQIAEQTMQDKDVNQKQWRKLLVVHLLIRKLLKSKIQKQMLKFKQVEKAYQEIKTATGVSDANQIVRRFLSKQSTYGNLLASIAVAQKKIQFQKKHNEELNVNLKHLREIINPVAESSNKKDSKLIYQSLKALNTVDSKSQTAVLYKEKLYKFGIKIANKIKRAQKNQPSREEFKRQQIVPLFQNISTSVLKYLKEISPGQYKQFCYQKPKPETEAESFLLNNRLRGRSEDDQERNLDDTDDIQDLDQSALKHKKKSK